MRSAANIQKAVMQRPNNMGGMIWSFNIHMRSDTCVLIWKNIWMNIQSRSTIFQHSTDHWSTAGFRFTPLTNTSAKRSCSCLHLQRFKLHIFIFILIVNTVSSGEFSKALTLLRINLCILTAEDTAPTNNTTEFTTPWKFLELSQHPKREPLQIKLVHWKCWGLPCKSGPAVWTDCSITSLHYPTKSLPSKALSSYSCSHFGKMWSTSREHNRTSPTFQTPCIHFQIWISTL